MEYLVPIKMDDGELTKQYYSCVSTTIADTTTSPAGGPITATSPTPRAPPTSPPNPALAVATSTTPPPPPFTLRKVPAIPTRKRDK